jgi:hypothetical protein
MLFLTERKFLNDLAFLIYLCIVLFNDGFKVDRWAFWVIILVPFTDGRFGLQCSEYLHHMVFHLAILRRNWLHSIALIKHLLDPEAETMEHLLIML